MDPPAEIDREEGAGRWRGLRNVMFCVDASEASAASLQWAFVNHAVRVPGEVAGEGEVVDVHAGEPVSYPNSEEQEVKAMQAVREAVAAAADTVHVVHVCAYPTPSTASPYGPLGSLAGGFAAVDDYSVRMKAAEEDAKALVKRHMGRLMALGVPKGCIRGEVLWVDSGSAGTVGDRLVRYADTHAVDLLVIGSRGMGTLKSAVLGMVGLGSVSQRVVHAAKCPVLLSKPPAPSEAADAADAAEAVRVAAEKVHDA